MNLPQKNFSHIIFKKKKNPLMTYSTDQINKQQFKLPNMY